MCHVTPYAASAAHISRFAAPTFRCRPTGLTLHAGLEPYNRYRDLGKYFFIDEKIFRTIEPGRDDLVTFFGITFKDLLQFFSSNLFSLEVSIITWLPASLRSALIFPRIDAPSANIFLIEGYIFKYISFCAERSKIE